MKKLLKWISIAMLFAATGQLIAAESYGESKHSFYKKGSKEEKEVLDKFFK